MSSDQIQEDRKRKDEAVRATIMQKLIETGEKENLKEMLRTKLIECGWRDDLREHCKEVIRSKGLERITVDELVQMITPRGRDTVPDQIKADLLQRIRQFLQST
jgi:enhancer of yellow 2 transcription factor